MIPKEFKLTCYNLEEIEKKHDEIVKIRRLKPAPTIFLKIFNIYSHII
ncbi:MAG: hypothetical protein ABIN73_03840 [candidate division WOR-3 bacterium]